MFSKYGRVDNFQSKYCYKNTNIIKNKFNIRDEKILKDVETDLTSNRLTELHMNPLNGRFTRKHLKCIHKYIFQDIYNFAGQYRTEEISKGETSFLRHEKIESELGQILDKLREDNLLKEHSYDGMVVKLAYYFAELNYIHPFREGNGRTLREFVRELVIFNEYEIDWSLIEGDELLGAMVAAVYKDYRHLENCLRKCLYQNEKHF